MGDGRRPYLYKVRSGNHSSVIPRPSEETVNLPGVAPPVTMARLASVAATLAWILVCVFAAPQQFRIDPDRIYTPGDLKELQIAIAYEKCLNTPGCDTSIFSNPSGAVKCKVSTTIVLLTHGHSILFLVVKLRN